MNKNSLSDPGFVDLSEYIPGAVFDIRYYTDYNFVGTRIDGYDEPVALMTDKAANALRMVSERLYGDGYIMKIYDAYRPQRAVEHFRKWASDISDTKMRSVFYPETEKSELFAKGYIIARSGHSRGSTVDLTLCDKNTLADIDMGGVFDYFGDISHPDHTEDLTHDQINNRNILRNAMISGGFEPLSTEWWHFTLKDEPYPDTYFDFPIRKPSK